MFSVSFSFSMWSFSGEKCSSAAEVGEGMRAEEQVPIQLWHSIEIPESLVFGFQGWLVGADSPDIPQLHQPILPKKPRINRKCSKVAESLLTP